MADGVGVEKIRQTDHEKYAGHERGQVLGGEWRDFLPVPPLPLCVPFVGCVPCHLAPAPYRPVPA